VFAYLQDLTDAQRMAVTHDRGALRILAGAGTGKTTTLSTRVAWLIATGTPPGARGLLAAFKQRGARVVIASNAIWRKEADYWTDFRSFGIDGLIDAVVIG
jgi:AAA domain